MTRILPILLLCLLPACLGGEVQVRQVEGRAPVERITVTDTQTDGRRISVRLEEEADWRALVDLAAFQGFTPGMTQEEARKRIGPPDVIQDSAYVYDRPAGRVIVVRVEERSGSEVFRQWQVRAEPTAGGLAKILAPEIVEQLRPLGVESSEVVLLHPSSYSPLLRVQVREDRVTSMIWYESTHGLAERDHGPSRSYTACGSSKP